MSDNSFLSILNAPPESLSRWYRSDNFIITRGIDNQVTFKFKVNTESDFQSLSYIDIRYPTSEGYKSIKQVVSSDTISIDVPIDNDKTFDTMGHFYVKAWSPGLSEVQFYGPDKFLDYVLDEEVPSIDSAVPSVEEFDPHSPYYPDDYQYPLDNGISESPLNPYSATPQNRLVVPGVQDAADQREAAETEASPLVLDLDGDGVELTPLDSNGAVYWDIDQDGFAEATGWVAPEDGLLAYDRNNDGIINNHSELFGTEIEDGFLRLAEFDSNSDGLIDANDAQFKEFKVWRDSNNDGFSQSAELHSLNDLDIASINLNYIDTDYYIAGNNVRSESTFTKTDGSSYQIVDAWFAYDNLNTIHAGEFTLDVRTFFVPKARGYGNMADLHIAMSKDETLLDMQSILMDELHILQKRIRTEQTTDVRIFWDRDNYHNENYCRDRIVSLLTDRLSVNQDGERVHGFEVNTLTVMANGAYQHA